MFCIKTWKTILQTSETFFQIFYHICYGFALRDFQVMYLSFIGGEDEKDTICKAMGAVIGNDCAKLYNWYGKKGKKKFADLQLAKVVYCKCRKFLFLVDRFLYLCQIYSQFYMIF